MHEILRMAIHALICVTHEILSGEMLILDCQHAHDSARTLATCNVASLMTHYCSIGKQYRHVKCDRASPGSP